MSSTPSPSEMEIDMAGSLTSLAALLASNRLEADEPIVIRRRSSVIEGKVMADGQIRVGTMVYRTPSGAAKAEMGVRAVDGWAVWRLPRLEFATLGSLRDEVPTRASSPEPAAEAAAEPEAKAKVETPAKTTKVRKATKADKKARIEERAASRRQAVDGELRIPLTSESQEVLVERLVRGLSGSGRVGHMLVVNPKHIERVRGMLQAVVDETPDAKRGSDAATARTLVGKLPPAAEAGDEATSDVA